MMKKILKSKLLENIISLSTIKGLQYVLAFVTFPYLVRCLQVENYGLIVYAQSVVNYCSLVSDYGFNLTGPREIAQNDTREGRGRIFQEIFTAKLCLLIACSLVFCLILFVLNCFQSVDFVLYAVVYITVIGNVLFPVWFFQGIQQMRYITLVNVVARVFSVFGIFAFVREPQDYVIAAFFQSMTPLVAAICSWVVIVRHYPEVICRPSLSGAKQQIIAAWPIFTSNIAINLYTASNIVFLGLLTNNTVVGYFSGAKKIIDNITQLFSPISQAIYPYVSKKVIESRYSAIIFLRKVVKIFGGFTLALSTFILIFAPLIVRILLGNGYEKSIILLRVMGFLPFLIALSNVFGIQTMINFGMQREFSKILILAAVLNTSLVLPLIWFYAGLGVCISITLTECFVTLSMWYLLRKNKIDLF